MENNNGKTKFISYETDFIILHNNMVISNVSQMNLDINLDTYDLYDGKTPQEVFEKHENNQRFWKFNFFGTKKHKLLRINPFQNTCIGVYVYEYNGLRYTISITQTSKFGIYNYII